MEKQDAQINQFSKAVDRFAEVLAMEKTLVVRDSAIQRFEFTFDLAWKTLQAVLEEKFGVRANAPKTAARLAHENGLIADLSLWLSMIDDRNLTTHSYNEEIAEKIYAHLRHYADLRHQGLERAVAQVEAVYRNAPRSHIVKPRDEIDERRLPCAAGPDKSRDIPHAHFQIYIFQYFFILVFEMDALESHAL